MIGRIARHWRRMRSISPEIMDRFIARDVQRAREAAGITAPMPLTFDERVNRHLRFARRDPGHLRTIRDPQVRTAVRKALAEGGDT